MADKVLPTGKVTAAPAAGKPVTAAAAPAAKPAATAKPAGGVQTLKGSRATGVRGQMEERQELGSFGLWMRDAVHETPSWLVSMVFHMILLLALALIPRVWASEDNRLDPLVSEPGDSEEFDDLEKLDDEPFEDIDVAAEVAPAESTIQEEQPVISPADDIEAVAVKVDLDPLGTDHAPRNDLMRTVGAYTGTGLQGRGSGMRGKMVRRYGGNEGSEKAVAAALKWLAEHQMPDGGWSFDHSQCPRCRGQCRNAGSLGQARLGATAMAILPFLAHGDTHKEGKYKSTVKNGLYFLVRGMKVDQKGGSMHEQGGRMYSHGLASIAVCEAYGMTRDKGLHGPAQAAVNFICYAQDPAGGGWRYEPRQKGDTSVVGWQIMALKSGHMAYLRVPPLVVKKAFHYLDGVQADSGATYGYTGPGSGQATTAIGLLCRMYLGWKKENPALQRGVQKISAWGPAKGNMYYNYYATQVMRHIEGELWKKWNGVMRDQLTKSQATQGHEAGSWFMKGGDHGAGQGGRLYCTSMATMILEVYYRHMPIFQKQATEEDFPEE